MRCCLTASNCVRGGAAVYFLRFLPIRHIGAVTYHTDHVRPISWEGLPPTSDPLRIFMPYDVGTSESPVDMNRWFENNRPGQPPCQVCLPFPLNASEERRAAILSTLRLLGKRWDWRLKPLSGIWMQYDDDCAPCDVCGGFRY